MGGVLDWSGSPKAPWFVLRRSAKPIALLVTDDGMDGLRLDAINETAEPVVGEIRFRAHSRSGVVPVDVALPVKVEAHSSLTWSVDSLVGRFTDSLTSFGSGRGHTTPSPSHSRTKTARWWTKWSTSWVLGAASRAIGRTCCHSAQRR